jgi:hypothetical protein
LKGKVAPQYDEAIKLAISVTGVVGSNNVTYVGHSLGGGLAAAASLVTQAKAVTINAATASNAILKKYSATTQNASQLITAFYIRGEVVSDVQRIGASGLSGYIRIESWGLYDPVGIAQGKRIGLDSISNALHAIKKHSMDEVLLSMKP